MDGEFVKCSRRRKLSKNYFDSLPDDILIQILIRIPARHILESTMSVCRKWHQLIHTRYFIFAHLKHSPSGLLLQNLNRPGTTFMSMTQAGQIETSNFSYKSKCKYWSSCNGLMLEVDSNDEYEIMITNPVTNQHFALPPFLVHNQLPIYSTALAFVDTHMEHKVVRTYRVGVPNRQSRVYCAILTFEVDKSWRLVDTQHLSLAESIQLAMFPLVTEGGFVHWAEDWLHNNYAFGSNEVITSQMRNNYILTLNLETEIITRIPAPQCNGGYYYYRYLSGGSYLSLLISHGHLKWDVWEMEPETGEWTKLPDIDLEAHKGLLNESYDVEESALKPSDGDCLDCKLTPAGWLKYPEVIVFVVYRPIQGGIFRQARLRVFYDFKTRDISLLALHSHYHPYIHHRNSLAIPPSNSIPGTNGHINLRDRNRDDTLIAVRDRKVRITENASLYTLRRSWLRNGFPEEPQVVRRLFFASHVPLFKQPRYLDAVKSLPRPLPVAATQAVESPDKVAEDNEEEDEAKESIEQLSEKELLQRHIKHAKRVRSRLREERLQRISRYKTRLALLLPPTVEQQFKNESTEAN